MCLIFYTMLYIYVAGLIEAGFSLCVGSLLPGVFGVYKNQSINLSQLCFCCPVVVPGGGLPTCGGRVVPLMIFRVSSGGLLVLGHFGYLVCVVLMLPGELCPGAPCW